MGGVTCYLSSSHLVANTGPYMDGVYMLLMHKLGLIAEGQPSIFEARRG